MLIIIAGNMIDVVNILTRLGIRMVKSELEPCRYLKSTWSRNGAKKTGRLKKKMLMHSHTNTHTHTHRHRDTHTHTKKQTHTHTQTHRDTHTHTHTDTN